MGQPSSWPMFYMSSDGPSYPRHLARRQGPQNRGNVRVPRLRPPRRGRSRAALSCRHHRFVSTLRSRRSILCPRSAGPQNCTSPYTRPKWILGDPTASSIVKLRFVYLVAHERNFHRWTTALNFYYHRVKDGDLLWEVRTGHSIDATLMLLSRLRKATSLRMLESLPQIVRSIVVHAFKGLISGVHFAPRLAKRYCAWLLISLAATLIGAGNAGSAVAAPAITKTFGVSSIALTAATSLTLTITNLDIFSSLTGVAFTDNLPAGLVVSAPNELSSSCGGTAVATAGSSTVSLAGGTLAAAGSCSISLVVIATTAGVKNNSVTVTSTNGGTGNTATATITVVAPPDITKVFGVASLLLNRSTSLTLTITNPNFSSSLTGVAFTDSLPAGIVVSTPNGLSSSCGGTAVATAGSSTVSLAGGTLAAAGSCSISVNVTATIAGVKINSVTVTSTNGATGGTSSAVITVTLSHTNAHDYNGDGRSDIAWRDTSGSLSMWLMSRAAVLSSGGLGNVPTAWSIVGQRDFDGDGKADLLWRDTSGNTAIWFMNGATVASSGSLGNIPTNWTVVATADFDGDGHSDILWRDGSGNLAMWLMNGATVVSSGGLGNVPVAWTIVGTGDYNGDGKADLLWRDTSGNTAMWFMNGKMVSSSGSLGNIPSVWSVVGTGDFDGDGHSDILWRDGSGNLAMWLMNGAAVVSSGGVGNVPTVWSVVATGDFDGDGRSDLLWRDTSGNTVIWFMNGAAIASTGGLDNIPTVWTVQSGNAE